MVWLATDWTDGRPGVPGRPRTSTVIRPCTRRSSCPAPVTSVTVRSNTAEPWILPVGADRLIRGPATDAWMPGPLSSFAARTLTDEPWIGDWTYCRTSTVCDPPAFRPRTVMAETVGGGALITRTL